MVPGIEEHIQKVKQEAVARNEREVAREKLRVENGEGLMEDEMGN